VATRPQSQRPDAGAGVGTEDHTRSDADQVIDQPGAKKAGRKLPAALAKDARQTFGTKGLQQKSRIQPLVFLRNFEQIGAKVSPEGAGVGRGIGAMGKPKRRLGHRGGKPAAGQIKVTRGNHAHRLARNAKTAHGQLRVIGTGRAGADQNRIMAGAQSMDARAGLRSGDPTAFARSGGDAAIKAAGQFQCQHRATQRNAGQEALLQGARLGFQHRFGNCNPGGAQDRVAAPRNTQVRIGQSADDSGDTRRDKRLGAGRGAPVMRARFERDIGSGAARRRTRLIQRHPFRMGATARLGPATPQNTPVLHDHTAHGGVWPDIAKAPTRQRQGQGHIASVSVAHSPSAPLGRSSDTNLSKSSAAWKFL